MNAYRNGALESLSIAMWFNGSERFRSNFLCSLYVSEKEHELWYGDKRLAQEMEKEQLVAKMYCNLKRLSLRSSKLGGINVNYKNILK